jgi:hypothetical protein
VEQAMTTLLLYDPATMHKYLQEHVPTEHDIAVRDLIKRTIDRAYDGALANRGGATIATVSFVLEKCFAPGATRTGNTTDEVSRDAEYYFKSRYLVARDKHLAFRVWHAVEIDGMNAGYFAMKSLFWRSDCRTN